MRKVFILLFLVFFISGFIFSKSYPVKVVKVEKRNFPDRLFLSGTAEPWIQNMVSSKVPGKIKEIKVKIGDRVKAGDVLFKLEDEEYQKGVLQAKFAYQAARAQYEAALHGARPQEKAQVRKLVEQAKASYMNALSDYRRMKALYEKKAITKQQFEGIETKYIVAKAQYEQAKKKLELIEIGVREEDKEALRANMERAKAAWEMAKIKLDDTIVRSPFEGVVVGKFHESGEVINAGMPVLKLVNYSRIKLSLPVSEINVLQVKSGMKGYFKTDYLKKYFTGEVYEVNPAIDPETRNFEIKVLVENEGWEINPGSYMEGYLILKEESYYLLPQESLVHFAGTGGDFIFKVIGKKVEVVRVNVQNKVDNLLLLTEGVKEGDVVVYEGTVGLHGGDEVEIKEEKSIDYFLSLEGGH